jgi:hypothetical protein
LWNAAQPLIPFDPSLKLGTHGLDQPPRLSRAYAQLNTKRVCRNRLLVRSPMRCVHFPRQL